MKNILINLETIAAMIVLFQIILILIGVTIKHYFGKKIKLFLAIQYTLLGACVLCITMFSGLTYYKLQNKPVEKVEYTKQQLISLVEKTAAKYGVPRSIALALVTVESNWNVRAVSKAQAVGLCQVMPSTFVSVSKGDIFNPVDNVDAGMKYLAGLYRVNGNWKVALAKYNGGNVYHKSNESQNYQKRVLQYSEVLAILEN